MEVVHTPVLLNECLEYLAPLGESYENHAVMVDSTTGEGGHSFNFLSKYPNLELNCLDADKVIQARAKERLAPFGDRVHFYSGWFQDFYADYPTDFKKPDIILFDLGISVFHYEKSERGFSFRYDEKLDMRLNTSEGQSAADLVNDLAEEKLADLIYLYGEENSAAALQRLSAMHVRAEELNRQKLLQKSSGMQCLLTTATVRFIRQQELSRLCALPLTGNLSVFLRLFITHLTVLMWAEKWG